ncbi:hypothetical protein [Polyangium jinanense]|uniref:Uncharacterized protein n=1 Tax=Polyangium jinanense TaxID=2829994 RepID=A0A9X3X967_9BACT|nr:hypothetical protein [Polyangium jinanense]MDC3959921.1 hypothetical protein [Polyangium jinanense]MDC3983801.1 hypothetical protein [Polyangium jinanense]
MSPPQKKKPPVDHDAAKAAFEKLLPRFEQIPRDSLQSPNTSVDAAAIVALGIARELTAPEARARFELLPKELFDIAALDDLEAAALAAWYAATSLLSAHAQGTEAKLPVALVDDATTLKTRMLKVGDYHFDPATPTGREIADIRVGTGYRDLAQDLARLARIYRAEKKQLENDKVHYTADDAARADELSHRILEELSASRSTEQALWAERVQRAFALLLGLYGEVTTTAAWIRRKEGGAAPYPSLVTAGRAARKARSEGAAEEPPPGGGDPTNG